MDNSLRGADPALNDSSWQTVNTDSLPSSYSGEPAWFRLHLSADAFFADKPAMLYMRHWGASEIYLDGIPVAKFGKVAGNGTEESIDPGNLPVNVYLKSGMTHVLAVRYSNFHHYSNPKSSSGFTLSLRDFGNSIGQVISNRTTMVAYFSVGVFLFTLALIHFLLFVFYRSAKENLYYSLFAFSYAMIFFLIMFVDYSTDPGTVQGCTRALMVFINPIVFLTLLMFIYRIFYNSFKRVEWLAVAIGLLGALDVFTEWNDKIYFFSLSWLVIFTIITMSMSAWRAVKEKRPGARILGAGIVLFAAFLFFILSIVIYSRSLSYSFSLTGFIGILILLLFLCALLSIPISMSIYLAYNFSATNRSLQKKLTEVEELSVRTIEQEKEKQRILESQKETLEVQVQERTREISEQKKIIEEKNKDITDSINYAKRIQEAILPAKEIKYRIFPDAFVLFRPKDIVSGDFYWFAEKDGKRLIAACDCTGHGVPGALMSMVGNNVLNEIVNEKGITDPAGILSLLHKEVRKALKQEEHADTNDGMDVALVTFHSQHEIAFAGAQRPLWIIRNGAIEEIKGDKFSIGGMQAEQERKFTPHRLTLAAGDVLYIFSDGFADQFGAGQKKLMTRKFKEELISIHQRPMKEQEKYLDEYIEKWKGRMEQTDDILVIGIRT